MLPLVDRALISGRSLCTSVYACFRSLHETISALWLVQHLVRNWTHSGHLLREQGRGNMSKLQGMDPFTNTRYLLGSWNWAIC